MKILIVLTYYFPYWTGLTKHAVRLAEGLAAKGHAVTVLTTQHDRLLPTKETIHHVTVIRTPVVAKLSRTLIAPSLFRIFLRFVREHDAVVVFMPFAEVFPITCIAKLFRKKVFLAHNGDLVLPKGIGNAILEKVYVWMTVWSGAIANAVIVNTEDYAEHSYTLRFLRKKWVQLFPPFPFRQNKTKQLPLLQKISRSTIVIGFAGRFVEEKGFDVLLRAMEVVCQKNTHILFAFAGETQMKYEHFFEQHRALVEREVQQKHLVLLGCLNDDQIQQFYTRCTAIVVPSRTDCFPFVSIEAMLAGTPVIVSDIPGARMSVRMTGMGKIFPAGDVHALAQAILAVVRTPTLYTKYHTNAKALFAYDKAITKYETCICS